MGLDKALKNTKASLNPFKNPKETLQAAYDPAEFLKKPEVPKTEKPGPAPTMDDAAAAAVDKDKKRRRSRASTIFTSGRGDTSTGNITRSVLLGD